MSTWPMYSYTALNALASNDTGHFVYLDAWTVNACLSILAQASPLYLWANDQHPLSPSEIDDLEAKLAEVQFQLMNVLVGMIMPIAAKFAPRGTLRCDGSIYRRIDFPALYDALEPEFIVDADYFSTPDLTHRFVMGAENGPFPIASTGGSATVTQTVDQMPSHAHISPPHTHSESGAVGTVVSVGLEPPVPAAVPTATFTGGATVTIEPTGGGQPMNVLPPYMALQYVIVAR